uniref:Putative secreted protein n=1 Tax=Ixodes ricinus TaxID=34613 RepID=A0A6B0U424_IXORI
MKMSLLKVIFLCIALFISVHSTNHFLDVPSKYVTSDCRDKATKFKISQGMSLPLGYDSAQFCMYQNLQVSAWRLLYNSNFILAHGLQFYIK